MPWVTFSSKDFRIQTSFWNWFFELTDPFFKENDMAIVVPKMWLWILDLYWLCDFGSDSEGEDSTLGVIIDWFKASYLLNLEFW